MATTSAENAALLAYAKSQGVSFSTAKAMYANGDITINQSTGIVEKAATGRAQRKTSGFTGDTSDQPSTSGIGAQPGQSGGGTTNARASDRSSTGGGANTANPPDVNSSQAKVPQYTSNEWYGKMGEYGSYGDVNDPNAFWYDYAMKGLGLPDNSATANWYAETFRDPYNLMLALGNNDLMAKGTGGALAAMTALGNQIAKPGSTFFSPGQIIQNVLRLAAKPIKTDDPNINILQATLNSPDPTDQVTAMTQLLGTVLQGIVPDLQYNAIMNVIDTLGRTFLGGIRQGPTGLDDFSKSGQTFASWLTQHMPSLMGMF